LEGHPPEQWADSGYGKDRERVEQVGDLKRGTRHENQIVYAIAGKV
jgi:hypothetical protein